VTVAIVTDSTCDMGPEALRALRAEMVPLTVHFGQETFRDWIELSPEAFYRKLAQAPVLPTTSQPTPGEFAEVYRRLAESGVDGIASVHLSSKLSGTLESALLAAKDAPVHVDVIDSLTVSGGLALVVKAACAARDAGGDLETIGAAARQCSDSIELFFVLDTLEFLVRGGRAGRAAGLAASLLNIKPVLEVRGGVIEPFMRSKGSRRAIVEMATHVAERSKALGPLEIRIISALADDLCQLLADAIVSAGTLIATMEFGGIGTVIGTHAGPRALGVAYHSGK